MNSAASIRQFLPFACPSIQYRVRTELWRQNPKSPQMVELQDSILRDKVVLSLIHSQQKDGWIGSLFHGYDSMESAIRTLCEKGVDPDSPVLRRALLALETCSDRLERGFGKVGKVLDDLGFGGADTIRAYLLAQAGNDKISFVEDQVEQALEVFKSTAQIKSLEDIYEPCKDKYIFRKGVSFPGIYQLRLLAWSQCWRTPENRNLMIDSIQNLVRLSPIPDIYVRYKSQLMTPASFCMHHFDPDVNRLSDAEWMQWFHRMELLARLGVVELIPELKRQAQALEKFLFEGRGLFKKKLNHPYFQKWGAYTGLALETDWKTQQRKINDLTFRSLLILHYSGA